MSDDGPEVVVKQMTGDPQDVTELVADMARVMDLDYLVIVIDPETCNGKVGTNLEIDDTLKVLEHTLEDMRKRMH